MPGEFFFLTFGGLGISLAGFAGLVFALDRRTDMNDPIVRWRIRHVATTGLLIAQTGLLVFPVFFLTESVPTTVRIISLVGLLAQIPGYLELRPGRAWPSDRRRKINILVASLTVVGWALNIWIASVGFLMLLFVLWLNAPIGTFMNAIIELRVDSELEESSK